MPEDAIETQEIKERLEEAEERARETHPSQVWLMWLSLSTAVIAVLAAIAALESGSYANDAIVQKNDAVLHQSKADDAWAYYHAKGIEAAIYATSAETAMRPDIAAKWRASSERETEQRLDIRRQADEQQRAVSEMNEQSEHSLHRHHQFAKSVTIFQVSIALAAIAALTRRKAMWWISLAMGLAGAAFFAVGIASH
jgi:uncharacterized protein DUF4337